MFTYHFSIIPWGWIVYLDGVFHHKELTPEEAASFCDYENHEARTQTG